MDCAATTICAPTSTGSMQVWGREAWPPLPCTVMVTRSAAASTGPGTTRALAQRQLGVVVQRIDGIAGEAVEQPFLHHHPAAAAAFLGRLEDEVDGAVEVPRLGKVPRGAEQHRRVPVMPAGMHLSGVGGTVRDVARLLHRQAVHVGAEADGPPRFPLRSTPTRPVPAMPRCTSIPQAASCCATRSDVRCSWKPSSGWAWMSRLVAASSAGSRRCGSGSQGGNSRAGVALCFRLAPRAGMGPAGAGR